MVHKRANQSWFIITLSIVWGLILCHPVMAAQYYVSPTGTDATGTGAISQPYRHIQHVLDNVAVSGDVLILRGGTYDERIRIRNSKWHAIGHTGKVTRSHRRHSIRASRFTV